MLQNLKIKEDQFKYLIGGKFYGEGLLYFGKGLPEEKRAKINE